MLQMTRLVLAIYQLANVNLHRRWIPSTSQHAKRTRKRHELFAIAQRDAVAGSAMEITRILHIIALHAPPTYSLTWRMARIEYAATLVIKSRRKHGERLLLLILKCIPRYILFLASYIVAQFYISKLPTYQCYAHKEI